MDVFAGSQPDLQQQTARTGTTQKPVLNTIFLSSFTYAPFISVISLFIEFELYG